MEGKYEIIHGGEGKNSYAALQAVLMSSICSKLWEPKFKQFFLANPVKGVS